MFYVYLYHCFFSKRDELWISQQLALMPDKLKLKRADFANNDLWQKRIIGRILLKDMITYLQGKFDVELFQIINGKPKYANLSLSLSYSGNLIVVAGSKKLKLGLDVEEIRPIDFSNFENDLSTEEWNEVKKAFDPYERFYEVWTRKECVAKADGRGLAIEPSAIQTLGKQIFMPDNPQPWNLWSMKIENRYIVSIACNYNNPKIVNLRDLPDFKNLEGLAFTKRQPLE